MLNLLELIDHTANQCLPPNITERKKKKTPIASWSGDVQPFKDDAFCWHSVWVSAGKPLNTELHKIMKRSRNIYHFQIRKCKRMVDTLKLLDACINGHGNLFDKIKKLRKSSPTVANAIDGISDDITKHFADIYGILYNPSTCKLQHLLDQ